MTVYRAAEMRKDNENLAASLRRIHDRMDALQEQSNMIARKVEERLAAHYAARQEEFLKAHLENKQKAQQENPT